jgi:hypothetical protein
MNVKKAKEKLGIIKGKVGKGNQFIDDAISLCKGKHCQADDVRKLVGLAHEELSSAVTFLRNFDLIVEI